MALSDDSLGLLRAVAEQVPARERRLAVYPQFVRFTAEPADGATPSDSARQRRVVHALAEALGGPTIDLALPDSARAARYSKLATVGIVAMVVQPDSAYVEMTFVPPSSEMHGQWMFTAYRYRYRREHGRWSFVRREWLGSA